MRRYVDDIEVDHLLDDGEPTPLECYMAADERLAASSPGFVLLDDTGRRHVRLDRVRSVEPGGEDTDMLVHGIVRWARWRDPDENLRGAIGEKSDGTVYQLRRRDDGLHLDEIDVSAPPADPLDAGGERA